MKIMRHFIPLKSKTEETLKFIYPEKATIFHFVLTLLKVALSQKVLDDFYFCFWNTNSGFTGKNLQICSCDMNPIHHIRAFRDIDLVASQVWYLYYKNFPAMIPMIRVKQDNKIKCNIDISVLSTCVLSWVGVELSISLRVSRSSLSLIFEIL